MALKTKPSQITAEDHRLVRQFIKDSKAAGYDPTLTTIVLNKVRSDKSGKTAKKVAGLQRRKPQGKPKVDPARAARSAEARRQAAQAGREGKAIREEGGYLTGEEWAKMAGEMLLTVAGGAGVNLLLKGAGAAVKGGQALLKAPKAAKLLKGAPKLLKGRKGLGGPKPKSLPPGGPKQLPAGGGPKGGGPLRTSTGRPLGSPKQLADKTAWVARQEAAKKALKEGAKKVKSSLKGKPKAKPKGAGKIPDPFSSIKIPADVRNVNTVQDAAKRLAKAMETQIKAWGSVDEGSKIIIRLRKGLESWIHHARHGG